MNSRKELKKKNKFFFTKIYVDENTAYDLTKQYPVSLMVRSDRKQIKFSHRITAASLIAGSVVSICVTRARIKPASIRPDDEVISIHYQSSVLVQSISKP